MTKNITDKNFESLVVKSQKLTLVDFWAEWCGPCKQLVPVINELSSDLDGQVNIFKMNIDDNAESPSKYGVRSIPTMMLFKDGKLLSTKVGALPKSTILDWIDEHK